jgi:outer membrane protein OmpA-like peptidoglycan-associated protein
MKTDSRASLGRSLKAAGLAAAVVVAVSHGCGASVAAVDLQSAIDDAGIVLITAAADADGSPEYALAQKLLTESISQQDDGRAWASYYLALRAAYTADAARVSATHGKASKRLDQLRRDTMEARLRVAQTEAETADTRRTIAETIQARAQAEAIAARAEATTSDSNAAQTTTDAQADVEKAQAEAELGKAKFLLDLAAEADAATHDADAYAAAQGLITDTEALLSSGSYRAARLKAIAAYAAARDTRLAAVGKAGTERSKTGEARLQRAVEAAGLLGTATAAVERAQAAHPSDPAPAGVQSATDLLTRAEAARADGSYAEASRLAAEAVAAAEAALVTGEQAQAAADAARRREELEAMVKDAVLRVRRAPDSLDSLTRRLSPNEIANAGASADAAEAALAAGSIDEAVGRADRIHATMDAVEQRAADVRATEDDLVARAKSLPNTQAFTTSKGLVLRLSGPFFAVGKTELRKSSLPSVSKFAAAVRDAASRYDVLIEGHTDKSGEDATNVELSRKRASAFAVALKKYIGVPDASVESSGYGTKQLISGIPPTDARNRRIEIVIRTRKPS